MSFFTKEYNFSGVLKDFELVKVKTSVPKLNSRKMLVYGVWKYSQRKSSAYDQKNDAIAVDGYFVSVGYSL